MTRDMISLWDLPGGSVVQISGFQCRNHVLILGQGGSEDPTCCVAKRKKKEYSLLYFNSHKI